MKYGVTRRNREALGVECSFLEERTKELFPFLEVFDFSESFWPMTFCLIASE
jgi:hypothetical protein